MVRRSDAEVGKGIQMAPDKQSSKGDKIQYNFSFLTATVCEETGLEKAMGA